MNASRQPPGGQRPRPTGGDARTDRERVLARRRMALVTLGVLAVVTLAVAIVTGSWPILIISLVVDVALAAYIALLLQIKQNRSVPPPGSGGSSDVRVVGR